MKYKLSNIIKIFLSLMLTISFIFPGYLNSTSVAEGEVTSSEELVGNRLIIDGKAYVVPQTDFMINYTINNGSNANISQIIIKETLKGGGTSSGGKRVIPDLEYPAEALPLNILNIDP